MGIIWNPGIEVDFRSRVSVLRSLCVVLCLICIYFPCYTLVFDDVLVTPPLPQPTCPDDGYVLWTHVSCVNYLRSHSHVSSHSWHPQHPPTEAWRCILVYFSYLQINTLRLRQNHCHFADDDTLKYISLNENFWILDKISLKHVPWCLIDDMAALIQIMAWLQTGNKPLSEAMLVHCTDAYMHHSPQWVKKNKDDIYGKWKLILFESYI